MLPRHQLHYRIDGDTEDGGSKPWLMFCNSLGTDLHMWDTQARELSDRFRVLRYDRRGHGRSTAPSAPFTLSDLGKDVLALLDALQIDRTHFCGLSIGGLTGLWLCLHASERVDRVIVCATAAKIGSAENWNVRIDTVRRDGLEGLAPDTMARWFTPTFATAERATVDAIIDVFSETSLNGYVGCCAALADADLHKEIERIGNPLLAISGKDDPVCPPADLEAIASGVQQGRHVSLPGRHIVNVESQVAFNTVLSQFLDNPEIVN
jgi:3-oxoadipate enol-lactonase